MNMFTVKRIIQWQWSLGVWQRKSVVDITNCLSDINAKIKNCILGKISIDNDFLEIVKELDKSWVHTWKGVFCHNKVRRM